MKTIKYLALIAILFSTLTFVARATEPDRQELVDELMTGFDIKNSTKFDIDKIVDLIIESDPQFKPYRDVFIEFFTKYLTWEGIKPVYEDLFLKEFSNSDLININMFLLTPAFKNWLAASGDIDSLPEEEKNTILDFTTSDIGIKFSKITQELSEVGNKFVGNMIIKHKKELDSMMEGKKEESIK